MVRHPNHVTVADLAAALRFFALLGFEEGKSVINQGEPFGAYMGARCALRCEPSKSGRRGGHRRRVDGTVVA